MQTIVRIIISSLSIFFAAWLLPGVEITNFPTAILVAIVIALLNVFFKPIFIILTIPITIFTFGIFLLFINAILFIIASYFLSGFDINGIFTAFIFSILVSVFNFMLGMPRKTQIHHNKYYKRNDYNDEDDEDKNNYIQI